MLTAYLFAKRTIGALLGLLGLRVVAFWVNRIGHLTIEPDIYIKEHLLGLAKRRRDYLFVEEHEVVNRVIWNYWRPQLAQYIREPFAFRSTVLNRAWRRLLRTAAQHPDYVVAPNRTAPYTRILSAWGDLSPLLKVQTDHVEAGCAALERLGVPRGSWFVCFHVRESGYRPAEGHHDYRNADIESYSLAMQAVVERGGWCLRMGDANMKPLVPRAGVIDYALSKEKSELLDIVFAATCRLFVGSNSGLQCVATVFGRPLVVSNVAPMSQILQYSPGDIAIPKLVWSTRLGRLLSFREILSSPASNYRSADQFERAGLRVVDNSPEDLRQLCIEGLRAAAGQTRISPGDRERADRFLSLLRPGHFSFNAPGRVGSDFLRKHESLL